MADDIEDTLASRLQRAVPRLMTVPIGRQLDEEMNPGHYLMVYSTSREHLAAAAAFVAGGLAGGEPCYYALGSEDVPAVRSALSDAGFDVEAAEARGDLSITSVEDVYLEGGVFCLSRALKWLSGALEATLQPGSPGVRVGGDVARVSKLGVAPELLTKYEEMSDAVIADHPAATVLCAYDRESMGGPGGWDLIVSHPTIFYSGYVHENRLHGRGGEAGSDAVNWLQDLREDADRRERTAFLAALLENSSQPIAVAETDGTPVLANRAFEDLTEMRIEEDTLAFRGFFAPLVRDLEQGQALRRELDFETPEGNVKPLLVLAHSVVGPDDRRRYVCAFASDIAGEHQTRKALERERDVIAKLMDTSPAGITLVNRDGTIAFANAHAESILGLERSGLRDRTYDAPDWSSTDFAGSPIQEGERIFDRVMEEGRTILGFEERIERPDGSQIYLRINGAPLRDEEGAIEGVVFSLHDVTDLHRAEELRDRKLSLLSSLASCETLREATEMVLDDVMELAGVEAGAIRFSREDNFTYYVTRGFSPAFVRAESDIAALSVDGTPVRDGAGRVVLECVCGRVLRGEVPLEHSEFTPHGSFYVGDAETWLARLGESAAEDRTYRARCYQEGYRSIALIPVYAGVEVMGLIQLNDSNVDALAPEVLSYAEEIATPAGYIFSNLRTREALRVSENKYRNLVERASDAIVIVQDYVIKFANPRIEDLLGYLPEEIVDTEFLRHVEYEEIPSVVKRYNRRMTGEDEAPIYRTRLRHRDGSTIHVEINAGLVSFDGRSADMVMIRDVSDRVRFEQRMRYLGMHDQLTELYNRTYFEEELKRLDVDRQMPMSLVMADVNGLKLVNDAFGRQEGDSLLREVASMLRQHFREEDVIARWGGDEFIIILPNTDATTAEEICERLEEAFSEEEFAPVDISVSLGTATKESPEEDIQQVLRRAEERMYRSKTREACSVRGSILDSLRRSLRETGVESREHSRRLRSLTTSLGRRIEVTKEEIEELVLLADLHDIGKIALPTELLNRGDILSEAEWKLVRGHPAIGYRIAQSSPDLWPIADAILAHHEWWDGGGYPRGVSGEDIPLTARILAIADAYDVMVTGRSYRSERTHEEAIAEMKGGAGTQFDPNLVEAFVQMMEGADPGSGIDQR